MQPETISTPRVEPALNRNGESNSRVRFRVEPSGKEYELTLVYPKDLDDSSGQISILAPVGSALLGLRIGQQIEWPALHVKRVRVRIVDILYQPEREEDYRR